VLISNPSGKVTSILSPAAISITGVNETTALPVVPTTNDAGSTLEVVSAIGLIVKSFAETEAKIVLSALNPEVNVADALENSGVAVVSEVERYTLYLR